MRYIFWSESGSLDLMNVKNYLDDVEISDNIQAASERFECVSISIWLKYVDLQDWLDNLTSTDFFEQSSRKKAADKFRSMKRERNIVNFNERFPNEFYVCMSNKKISGIILGIISSINIDKDSSAAEVKDSNRAFQEAIKSLNAVCCPTMHGDLAQYGIFTRTSFEEHYSLKWIE